MPAVVLLAAPLILLAHWAVHQTYSGDDSVGWQVEWIAERVATPWEAPTTVDPWRVVPFVDEGCEDTVSSLGVAEDRGWKLGLYGDSSFDGAVSVMDGEVRHSAEISPTSNQTDTARTAPTTDTDMRRNESTATNDLHAPAERVLRRELARADSMRPELRRRARVVTEFVSATADHLRRQSPLLRHIRQLYAGGVFEGTAAQLAADFDTFALLPRELTAQFQVTARGDGLFQARLPARSRHAVLAMFPELSELLDGDGFLNAFRLKQWAFALLQRALRLASRDLPELDAVLYQTRGACGANLTAADGAVLEVDLGMLLTVSEPTPGHLRPESLRRCGVDLRGASGSATWFLYSEQDITGASSPGTEDDQRNFVGNAQRLEHRLLSRSRTLRDVVRLMKRLSHAQRWHELFHLESFVLKQAAFWTFAQHCRLFSDDTPQLLPALVATISTLRTALRSGSLPEFFLRPGHNGLRKLASGSHQSEQLAERLTAMERLLYLDPEQVFNDGLQR